MSTQNEGCPACGGTKFVSGSIGPNKFRFFVDPGFFSLGHKVEAFACLKCGMLAFRLEPEHLAKLQVKYTRP